MPVTSTRARVFLVAIVFIVAAVSLLVWKRYEIALWYAEKTGMAQEMATRRIIKHAQPILESSIKMSFFQGVFSALVGRRSEKQRQDDAIDDVKLFSNKSLSFRVARHMSSMDGYRLHGLDFTLNWHGGASEEVLAEFTYDFIKRTLGEMQINEACGFLAALKLYVETRAKAN
jgi:hypothetical protein